MLDLIRPRIGGSKKEKQVKEALYARTKRCGLIGLRLILPRTRAVVIAFFEQVPCIDSACIGLTNKWPKTTADIVHFSPIKSIKNAFALTSLLEIWPE